MQDEPEYSHLIVFDGYCIFCSGFARFMATHDRQQKFRFVTAQSDRGRALYERFGLDADELATSIVIIDGRSFTKTQAFVQAMRAIGGPWAAFGIVDLIPRSVADWVYDRIARNRYLFGRRDCALPSSAFRARLID